MDTKILPYFKNLKMNEITPGDVRKWQNEMVAFRYENGKSYSQTYKKTMHNILSTIFNHACRFYNLKSNPARQAGNMGREEKKEMLFWTTEEYKKFSEAVIDKPVSFYAFEMLYWTGMRLGELLALTMEDFDFEKNTVRINKSYQRLQGQDVITTPKTPKSNRTIKLPSMIKTVLVTVATLLTNKKEVTFEDILNESKEPIKSHLDDLLFFIENEGFIYSHQICKDEFSVPETVYSWGMQPAFDYLIGRKIYDVIKNGNNIDIEYTNGIYQMLSLIAIEEDEKLISEYSNIKLEESVLFDLICYTLANTSADILFSHSASHSPFDIAILTMPLQ